MSGHEGMAGWLLRFMICDLFIFILFISNEGTRLRYVSIGIHNLDNWFDSSRYCYWDYFIFPLARRGFTFPVSLSIRTDLAQ